MLIVVMQTPFTVPPKLHLHLSDTQILFVTVYVGMCKIKKNFTFSSMRCMQKQELVG